jgi:hypothetical protein
LVFLLLFKLERDGRRIRGERMEGDKGRRRIKKRTKWDEG